MENVSLILMGLFTAVIVLIILAILIMMKLSRTGGTGQSADCLLYTSRCV